MGIAKKFDPDFVMHPTHAAHITERKSPALINLQPRKNDYLTVDPARYFSREIMEIEFKKLWPRTWLCAGWMQDLPEIGSWFLYEIIGESIIVVRSGIDEVSAVFNVCQHKGNRLVNQPCGRRSSFTCPYHSWSYDLTGKNKRVTDRESFELRALEGSLDLTPVRCETWGGSVWINMDMGAPPLAEYLNQVTDILGPYQTEKMHIIQDVAVKLRCNWKTALDSFSEIYHVHSTHPRGLPVTEDTSPQVDFYRYGHSRKWIAMGTPSKRHPRSDSPNEMQKGMLVEAGIDPDSFAGGPEDVPAALRRAKRAPNNVYGLDYSRMTDHQLTDIWSVNIFPNIQFSAAPEALLTTGVYPDPHDPEASIYHIMVLCPDFAPGCKPPYYMGIPDDADTSGKTRPQRRVVESSHPDLKQIIGQTLWEDVVNIEGSQQGMHSRGFRKIRLSEQEQVIQHQLAEMDRYFED